MTEPRHAFAVRRSDRARRSRLTVTESGEVVVVLPRRMPLTEAGRLVSQHAGWLDRHLGRVRVEHAHLSGRPALVAGRVLHVDGIRLATSTVETVPERPTRGRVEVDDDRLLVRLGHDGRGAPDLLEAWLREQARTVITARVAARSGELQVRPGRITIRDQSGRWASASRSGALSFSWRLILAPPWVLEAVVVHELAHLRIRGHSRTFWSLVTQHAPRTGEARRWLREHAREIRAALE